MSSSSSPLIEWSKRLCKKSALRRNTGFPARAAGRHPAGPPSESGQDARWPHSQDGCVPPAPPTFYTVSKRLLVVPIGILVLGIWTVVGLYLWVPLLIRTAVAYSAAVVGTVLSGHNIAHAERALNEAIILYAKGFVQIYRSLAGIFLDTPPTPIDNPIELSWERSIKEFFLATAMWLIPIIWMVVSHLSKNRWRW